MIGEELTLRALKWVSTINRWAAILVSLFLTVSIGFWTGILINPQRFESLEIPGVDVTRVEDGWLIVMHVKNVGTENAEIRCIDVNGTVMSKNAGLTNGEGMIILIRDKADIWVLLDKSSFTYGTTAKITIHTSAGNRYTQLVILPRM